MKEKRKKRCVKKNTHTHMKILQKQKALTNSMQKPPQQVAVPPPLSNDNNSNDSNITSPPLRPPTSAYTYFQKSKTSEIRSYLISQSQDASFGSVAREVSERWRELKEGEREAFNEMARVDRERFRRESEERDRLVVVFFF